MVKENKGAFGRETVLEDSNLTKSQFLMWTGQRLNPGVPLYNMALAFYIDGAVDSALFCRAFSILVAECQSLRTVFDEGPRRRVLAAQPAEVELIDFSAQADPDKALEDWLEERSRTNFDLSCCLYDTALIELSPGRFVWYLNQHHLITDAGSTALLFKRLGRIYSAMVSGGDSGPELLPYEDYVDYERQFRHSPLFAKAQNQWRNTDVGVDEPTSFYGHSSAKNSTSTERVACSLGPERSRQLRAVAEEKGLRALTPDLSLFNIFTTLLFALIHRTSGKKKLSMGAPAHNRPTAAFRQTSGLFIEVFPLGVEVEAGESFVGLHQKVAAASYDFLRSARPGTSDADTSRSQDVLLNFINASFGEFAKIPTRSKWIHAGCGDSNHSLRLQVHDFDQSGEFTLYFDLNKEVFAPSRRTWVVQHFLRLVDGFLADRQMRLDQVDLLGAFERQVLLVDYNSGGTGVPHQTVVEGFEAQVERTPERVALVCGSEQLSYRQFNARANRVAHYLRSRGVGAGHLVGVCARRSIEMVVALYGVLKAGAAYVPLDPDHPVERSRFVVGDAGIDLVLAQGGLISQLGDCGAEVVGLEEEHALPGSAANLPLAATCADLAYGIYTSGSTGQPKGTLIGHESLANYTQWAIGQYLGTEVLDFPLFSSFTFDLTVSSLFVPLQVGGRLVVYPQEQAGMDLAILQVLAEDQVDVIKLTPSHLNLLRGHTPRPCRLKKLIVGGEDLKVDLARGALADLGDHIEIYNEYGPTEATVGCMVHRFDPQRDRGGSVPIGRPAANAQIYLLDEQMNPVGLGIEGELYLGGPGLARGYIKRPDLNAFAFVANPFQPGQRLYRSGDRARWTELGAMEFLGRRDDQVKIRGVRIELAEIEAVVSAHPLIEACAVRPVEAQAAHVEAKHYCRRCGLADNHPQARLNPEGVCAICLEYEEYETQAQAYFKNRQQLRDVFAQAKATKSGEYDCLMLLSGGKDSTYVLYQLVEMGLHPLVFSLDNGYISDGAKANIRRAVEDLGLDLVFASPPGMNEIFVDSLKRHSNVCNGCFKTIYTLSVKLAQEKGIKYIVTGLSRGQFFETRVADLFHGQIFAPDAIDRNIVEARKAYHRMDDAVSRCLDVSVFKDDRVFDEIQFIDFYRYCDVTLAEMYSFLDSRAPWVRPADTGRSTNCLINEAGIYLHKRERGFHNYALPYSWDVRLGHKQREAALAELDDDIDESRVRKILDEIGYDLSDAKGGQELRLAVYYTAAEGLDLEGLKSYLAARLPDYMMADFFVALDQLPLTANGKVDRRALPEPGGAERGQVSRSYVAPTTANERILTQVWAEVLRLEKVGVEDHFFDLGGDSILSIQIVARARQQGLLLEPTTLFEHPTIGALAAVARPAPGRVEQGPVEGEVPLTTIQRWFLAQDMLAPHHWNQTLVVEVPPGLKVETIEAALNGLVEHHDGLRLRFEQSEPGKWRQYLAGKAPQIKLQRVDLSDLGGLEGEAEVAVKTQAGMDLAVGRLVQAVLFEGEPHRPRRLLLAVHHLAVDGVSWHFLLEDLETACAQLSRGDSIELPAKTGSYQAWAEAQVQGADTAALAGDLAYWRQQEEVAVEPLSVDCASGKNTVASSRRVSVGLDAEATSALLRQVQSVYNTKVDEVLLAALTQTLVPWTGGDALRVDLEAHGRDGGEDTLDVSRTVGWFTSLFPVVLQLNPSAPPGEAIKSVKEQLRQVPDQGRPFALSKRSGYRSGAEILFNYLGQLDQLLPQASLLKLVGGLELSRDPGNCRQHLLEVAAYVRGGCLWVDWVYSENFHQRASIEELAQRYVEVLEELIEHCLSDGAGGHTPADFPLADFDEAKLGKLASLLAKKDQG